MLVRDEEWWAATFVPTTLDGNGYRLDVELRQTTAPGVLHGILFDWQDWNNFQLLVLVPEEGLVGLFAAEYGSWVEKRPLSPHPAAAAATNWHQVRVERLSASTRAWIDGMPVVDVPVGNIPSTSTFGFYAETLAQVPATLRVVEYFGRGEWQDAASTCSTTVAQMVDTVTGKVTASLCQTGRFARLGPAAERHIFLPLVIR